MAGQLDHRQDKASADHCRCDDDGLRCHFAVLAHSTVLATVPHVPVEYRVGKVNSLWNGVKTMPRLRQKRDCCAGRPPTLRTAGAARTPTEDRGKVCDSTRHHIPESFLWLRGGR